MNNNYYVYVYWRLDTNEPFYVGMGHGNRWKKINKSARGYNEHFMRITNKHPIAVEIIKNNLTKEQAHDVECWLINELVFEYGFSIDIPKNRSNEKGCHLVNCTWGGEGASGMNPWENKTEKEKREIAKKISEAKKGIKFSEDYRKRVSERVKGENNPMYGKHHSKESIEKNRKSNKGKQAGEKNPMYGTHRTGKDSANKKSVICLTTKRIFFTARDGARYYKCCISSVSACCRREYNSAGKLPNGTKLVWRWLVWKHNKKYRIRNK